MQWGKYVMKLNYELISFDYSSKDIKVEDNYIKIIGLDGSVTKIDIKYLPEKYIIKEDKDESLF